MNPLPAGEGRVREDASHAILLGIACALYVIIDIEHALLLAPFVALYIMLREISRRRRWADTLRMLAITLLVAAGLCAFYIVPALGELSAGSVGITARFGEGGTADAQFARDTGLSTGALLAAVADRAGAVYRPADLPYIVFGFFGPNSWYLGLVAIALAALGLGWLRRSAVCAIALALLLLAFAWAARAWLPVNPFGGIPFYGTLSGFRGMIHIAFFLCLLGGFGAAWLLGRLQRLPAQAVLVTLVAAVLLIDRPRPTLSYIAEVAALLGLVALALVAVRRQGWPAALLAALLLTGALAIDYRTAGAAVASVDSYFAADEIEAYRWLTAKGAGFRIWEYSDLYDDAEFLHTFSIAYNQTPRFGGYYDNGATGAQWRLYKWAKPERGKSYDAHALRTALRVSSVRYVLVHKRIGSFDEALSRLHSIGFSATPWQSANVTIVEDATWRPLALVYSAAMLTPGSGLLELAALPQAEQQNRLLIVSPEPLPAVAVAGEPSTPLAAAVQRMDPYTIRVQADAQQPGYLAVAESWHPGWRVTVDGRPAQMLKANVAFMAVRLDAGKHDVLYSYRPPSGLLLGWAGSIVTILALAVWKMAAGRIHAQQRQ